MNPQLWQPDEQRVASANISHFMQAMAERHGLKLNNYAELYQWSIDQPESFWRSIWDYCGVVGDAGQAPYAVDMELMPGARFFPQARLNFAENLLRYQDDRCALIARDEQGHEQRYSYAELNEEVARLAAALAAAGVTVGDRVAGYLPNGATTVIAMLAATRLGAIWSSCSPDFGSESLLDRFGQIEPKVLFTTAAYSYNGKVFNYLDKARAVSEQIGSIQQVVVAPNPYQQADLDNFAKAVHYSGFIATGDEPPAYARLPFNHPLYILFSSGTTGKPKCITHGAGGTLLQHLKELMLHTDLRRDDTICYYTTCGWMMWNWLVSSLAVGATVVLYDGSPFHPTAERMFELIDELGVTIFGTSAKSIAGWQNAGIDLRGGDRLGSLRTLLSTGSPLLPEQFEYVYSQIKSDLCLSSISGGTDIVSCFALGCPILPVHAGELQCRGLGMKVEIRADDGTVVREQTGELSCSAPFPSMPVGFWNDADGSRYRKAYFDRFDNIWAHGDYAMLTASDGLIIYGRSDATLNPGGVRIGTAEIYRQVEKLDEVVESLCVGQDWKGDQRIVLFVVLADGVELSPELRDHIRRSIRANTTPRHVPEKVIAVPEIPRTISGKIVELAVRNVIHGRPVQNEGALANPEALRHFANLAELET
ncbi:MAG: acetoacetate--CoA ligase [Wenzhouxiangellaceae bacterium]